MKKSRWEYESSIEKLAEEFFCLSSEESYNILKKTLRNKLWTEIWYYCKNCQYARRESTGEESLAEKYSGIINETIYKCFEAFNPKKGKSFISYLNAAMAKEISREKQIDYMHGMNISSRTRSLWKHLQNLAEYQGISSNNISEITKLGISIGKTEKEIRNAFIWGRVNISSDIVLNSNGEEYSLFDYCAFPKKHEDDPLEKVFETKNDYTHGIFCSIEGEFCKKQERTKPFISALLTLKFFTCLLEIENYPKNAKSFLFIDSSLYNELKECTNSKKPYPTQQDIAKRFKKEKTDASRTINRFLSEVQSTLHKKVSTFSDVSV